MKIISNLLVCGGLVALVVGIARINVTTAIIVAGVLAFGCGVAMEVANSKK